MTHVRQPPGATHAGDVLRQTGHRSAAAREQVLDALAERDCCATAQDLADDLHRGGSRVGTASIYRALELLVRLGLVRRLEMGHGTARYEAAHPDGEHHHHLVCDRCGKVTQFEDPALEDAIDQVAARLDYVGRRARRGATRRVPRLRARPSATATR